MKILELRFKNLNSLYGEWVVDFTDPAYVSSSIFALTGPTGAGKSTLLDAICLALYGATPRLGKITRGGNEIMSRQTGDCYAEVLFESQAGRFRCHWEQRRARNKADGNLQEQEHQIADGDTGKPVETKKRLVAGIIEEKTGMDFERFTRSILLAQGGFDTFLKADIEQKSKILEQITGTEIYSAISRRVHERQRDEREALKLLQVQTSAIAVLEAEEEYQLEQELEAKKLEAAVLAGRLAEVEKGVAWLKSVAALGQEISNLAEDAMRLQNDIESFKPEREKLDRGLRAASLDGTYATLAAIRRQQADDRASVEAAQTALPELASTAGAQADSFKEAERQTVRAKERVKAAAPLIRRIRSLDQNIAEQMKTVSEMEEICTKAAERIDAGSKARLQVERTRDEHEKNLKIVERFLTEHAQDEWLVSGFAGVEAQLGSLRARQDEIDRKESMYAQAGLLLEGAVKKLEACGVQGRIRGRELDTASTNLQRRRNTLHGLLDGKQLREYRAEKDRLLRDMAFLSRIAELEEHRARLEDGSPCPLCGSTEHPYAAANVPTADETEKEIETLTALIDTAENLEIDIQHLEEAEAVARKNLTEAEMLQREAASEKQAAERILAESKDSLEQMINDFEELKRSVAAQLDPLGYPIDFTDPQSAIANLASQMRAWQAQAANKAEIDKQIGCSDSELSRLDAIIDTQRSALAESRTRLEALREQCVAARDERSALYGDRNPDDEERRLNEAVIAAEAAEKYAAARNSELQLQLTTARTRIESLNKQVDRREPELRKAAAEFSSALEQAGFADEALFLEARLTNGQRDTIAARAKDLDDRQTELKARRKDREIRLAVETAQKVTDKSLAELEPQVTEYESSLNALHEDAARIKHRLSENAAAKERVKDKQSAIEAQKKECSRWEKLHALIGSADGKKYRNFAQGLTFELMVSHANRQLEKMTDRYLLLRDGAQPLELNVVDNYQAGEIRSTRNLSGGESFLVSLSLALGLSRMASRKVRVDSLFLDEGFGTLDEDSLETALDALSGLRQDNKLIGIISHISSLKERISTQIAVIPESGGRSTLAGPGCSRIDR